MRRCCCKKRGCVIFEDDFERSGPEPGPDWTIVSGDWSIDHWELLGTGDKGAILVSRQYRHTPILLFVDVVDIAVGDTYFLIANINRDECPCSGRGASFEIKDESVEISVGSVTIDADGTPALAASHSRTYINPGNEDFGLHLCISFDEIHADTQHFQSPTWACEAKEDEPQYFGLAYTSAQSSVRFDNFVALEHEQINPVCQRCPCECLEEGGRPRDSKCLPKTLLLTIFADNDLECLDGYTMELNWSGDIDNDELEWYWMGVDEVGFNAYCGYPPRQVAFQLDCAWRIAMAYDNYASPGYCCWRYGVYFPKMPYQTGYVNGTVISCDPFWVVGETLTYIESGSQYVSHIHFEITEVP